ncbi:MAG: right-handed parallel beta-helix repeat-containing protein, partial [Candidatus Bipolaricaulia bacterium]
ASVVHNQFSANGGDGVVVWRSAQATLANNTITENRNGVLLGRALQGETAPEPLLKLWGNSVFDNSGWGVAVYTMACGFAGAPQAFGGTIQGSANRIHDNGRGDLCPEDYPWPEGFTAGSG